MHNYTPAIDSQSFYPARFTRPSRPYAPPHALQPLQDHPTYPPHDLPNAVTHPSMPSMTVGQYHRSQPAIEDLPLFIGDSAALVRYSIRKFACKCRKLSELLTEERVWRPKTVGAIDRRACVETFSHSQFMR